MLPNRIAIYLTALVALAGGLAPVIANLDWTSTAGVLAGVVTVGGVAIKWLDGWQAYEARTEALDYPLIEVGTASQGEVPPQAL